MHPVVGSLGDDMPRPGILEAGFNAVNDVSAGKQGRGRKYDIERFERLGEFFQRLACWDDYANQDLLLRDRSGVVGFALIPCLKSQIQSAKLQINIKCQFSMTQTYLEKLFKFVNLGH